MPASSLKNYGGLKKLGAATPPAPLQKVVSTVLYRKGVRNFSVEIGVSHADKTAEKHYYAIVRFTNGNKAPPEKIAVLNRAYLEYGVPNISLSDEFIALCVLLQP